MDVKAAMRPTKSGWTHAQVGLINYRLFEKDTKASG
jgi:hypothetical protein